MKRLPLILLLLALLGLAACGEEQLAQPAVPAPPWAKVAPEQIAEAKKHGVPVAFENDLGMRFVLIPAGTFVMGSPEDEEGRGDDETQHKVTITKPYYMQITEVTNAQYRLLHPQHSSGSYAGHTLDTADQPVVQVTWSDATGFAGWLTQRDSDRAYRLPTEAEWERACRQGTQRAFGCQGGERDVARRSSISDRNDPSGPERPDIDDGHAVTAPAGSFAPNSWGLFDLHGNVQEWCGDWYGPYSGDAQLDPDGCVEAEAPEIALMQDGRASVTERARVRRGSNWADVPVPCATRFKHPPRLSTDELGFRLVCPLPEPKGGT